MESVTNQESAHAKYSPSKLSRIMRCPGSVKRAEALEIVESRDSEFAAEGTLLHELMEKAIDAWPEPHGIDFSVLASQLTSDPDRAKELALDYQQAIEDALAYIQDEINLETEDILYFQEVKVTPPIAFGEDFAGRVDLLAITPTAIHVADFKFGKGIKVDVKYGEQENEQLMAYMAGSFNTVNNLVKQGVIEGHERELYIHIIQPRIDNYQNIIVPKQNVMDFMKAMVEIHEEINSENPKIQPGIVQCKWCPIGALCEDRLTMVKTEHAKLLSAFADMDSGVLTIEDAIEVLKTEAEVKATYSAIRKFLYAALMQGKDVPGYKVIRKSKHRAWQPGTTLDDILDKVPSLEDKADLLFKTQLITPAQAETLIGKRKEFAPAREALATLIIKPLGEYEMVDENAKGEAVQPDVDMFSGMTGD